jgi:hypothetical protein
LMGVVVCDDGVQENLEENLRWRQGPGSHGGRC